VKERKGVTAPDPGPAGTSDPWAPWIDAVTAGLLRSAASNALALTEEQVGAHLDVDGGPRGDLAFPLHRFAAASGQLAETLARRLAEGFPATPGVNPPVATGAYVNFTVEAGTLVQGTLDLALGRGDRYGLGARREGSAVVEHTSANPTGPFHVGRVRNAVIGDTLARVLRAAGTPVTTQYYIDDMGRQAAMVTWIWGKPRDAWPEPIRAAIEGKERPDDKVDLRWGRPYPAVSAYLKEHPEAAAEVAAIVRQIESGAPPPEHRRIGEKILGGMLASLARLAIAFDEFVWESDLLTDGSVARALEALRHASLAVREENGAWAIDASGFALPKESTKVVFQRGDGTSLYVTRDVAYHLAKFARFSVAIDVLGQDHQLHARTLDALLSAIGETRRPTYVIYQDITVPDGGRMSTRAGSAVWLDELLEEAVERATREVVARRPDLPAADAKRVAEAVATGAVRYHIVRIAPDKPVRFRWEDALSFEGRSGPFLQYSHARASSVLRKGEAEAPPYPFDPARLVDPEELALVRVISRFPRSVAYAARTAHVHTIAGYAHDLAEQFNRFYHAVPVLRSGAERESRLALVAAARQTLHNALELLGIVPLDTM
jgi:arginyl-tRNA synthetase